MRVIGIDPGLATTGYGVVERTEKGLRAVSVGVLRTTSTTPHGSRLAELADMVRELVEEHRPQAAAVERLFFNANVKTAMAVGQAAGVMLATLARAGLEATTYTPPEVKSSVVGVGDATKKQVQEMTARLLGLAAIPGPPDAADACALAICHLNRSRLLRAVDLAEVAR